MTIADFDPQNFGRHYEEPPFMLHFQFKDGGKVCRYILIEEIDARGIKGRSKQKADEVGKTQKEIWQSYRQLE